MLDPWWLKHIFIYKRTWRPPSVSWMMLKGIMGHQFKSLLCSRLRLERSHFGIFTPLKIPFHSGFVLLSIYKDFSVSTCRFFTSILIWSLSQSASFFTHTCLQTMWHSSRHSTYPQLLLTDIFLNLLALGSEFFRYRKDSLSKKAKVKGAKRQKLEEMECIDFSQQEKGNL